MPTQLPSPKTVSTAATTEGTLAFAIAVLLMLVISTAVLLHPVADESANGDMSASSRSL